MKAFIILNRKVSFAIPFIIGDASAASIRNKAPTAFKTTSSYVLSPQHFEIHFTTQE